MAFSHGKSAVVYTGKYDLTSYLQEANLSQARETAEVTTFGKSSKVFIGGMREDTISASGFFDGAASAVDEVMAGILADADGEVLTIGWNGDTLGNRAAFMLVGQSSYEVSATISDAAAIEAEFYSAADDGADRGVWLRAKAAHNYNNTGGSPATDTVNGTGVNNGAATTNGWAAVLHVFAFTGTGATLVVRVQHSTDGSTWATLGTFATVNQNAPLALLIEGTGTVNQHLRLQSDLVVPATTNATATYAAAVARR